MKALGTTYVLILSTALGCAKPIPGSAVSPQGGGPGQGTEKNNASGTVEPGKSGHESTPSFALMESLPSMEGESFDFKKHSEIAWASENELVFSQDMGNAVTYDFKTKSWSSAFTSAERADYDFMYSFQSFGIVGITEKILQFRLGNQPIQQIPKIDGITKDSIASVNPGFLAFSDAKDNGAIKIIHFKDGKPSILATREAPRPIKSIGPCNVGCDAWVFDGKKLYTFKSGEEWVERGSSFLIPDGELPAQMAVRFDEEGGGHLPVAIVLRSESGKYFISYKDKTGDATTSVTWNEVLALSKVYCMACHVVDGYDKPTTWTNKKDDILKRILTLADAGDPSAMPKPGTIQSKNLSRGDRLKIAEWLNAQKATKGGKIDSSTSTGGDPDISGDLKTMANNYCIACHNEAIKESYWLSKQSAIQDRINSGNMPKGKSLNALERKKIIDLIEAL